MFVIIALVMVKAVPALTEVGQTRLPAKAEVDTKLIANKSLINFMQILLNIKLSRMIDINGMTTHHQRLLFKYYPNFIYSD